MPADRTGIDAEALRALLARQSEELAAETLRSGGLVSGERLEELWRLSRLVELRAAAARRPRSRWSAPLVAAGTLAAVSALLFARMSATEIEMELKASELSFIIPTVQVISDAMDVSSLGISGLKSIAIPGGGEESEAARDASNIFLAGATTGGRAGTVSLDPISVPARTRVSLRKVEGARRYRMVIQGAVTGLGVSVHGPVRLVAPPDLEQVRDFSYPRRVSVEPGSNRVSLEFALGDTSAGRRAFRSPLPAESLFLFRVDRFQQSEQTLDVQVPTIQSGTLYFESLDGQARPLRAGEGLHLAWSEGELRQLELAENGFLVRFHGRVHGMSAGSGDVRRSLMPTVLDWLRARHGLSFAWVTTVYLVGLFVSLLRWWRQPSW
jgi:hypothetical protein